MSQFHHFATASIEEDDHQSRLEDCKTFFNLLKTRIEDNLTSTNDGDELHDKVLFFLYDRWSVIRMHCFKSLRDIMKIIIIKSKESNSSNSKDTTASIVTIPYFINALIHTWNKHISERQRSWQDLHGCLLGFTAMIDVLIIRNPEYTDEIPDLIDICVDIMSHVRNPIRDAAKDCLVKIGGSSLYRRDLFPTLLNTIDEIAVGVVTSGGEVTEANTLKVDGLLGALVEIVPLMRSEIKLEIDVTMHSSPRALSRSQLSSSSSTINSAVSSLAKLSGTIRLCMKHPASTVRQKAGSIISSIMKFSLLQAFSNDNLTGDSTAQFAYLSREVLVSSLEDKDFEAWQSQEVCLIVSEELIREATTQYLQSLNINQKIADSSSSLQSFIKTLNDLSEFLQSHLHDLLCHPRFEVRRVVLQLLPTMARGRVVLFSSISHSECNNDSVTGNPSLNTFNFMVDMVWLSTLIKESRHVQEVLYSAAIAATAGNEGSELTLHAGENWSLEVHGRLLEVELRAEFHKQLETITTDTSKNKQAIRILCESAVDSATLTMSLLLKLFDNLDRQFQDEDGILRYSSYSPRFLSIDFVELISLCHCLIFTVNHRLADMLKHLCEGDCHQQRLDELFSSASKLSNRVNAYNDSWMKTMALLQLNSNMNNTAQQTPVSGGSSGTMSSSFNHINSNLVSFAANRPTSTELIILLLMQRNTELVSLKQQGMEFEFHDHLRLLPTLTDPATNPILYAEDLTMPVAAVQQEHDTHHRSSSRQSTPYSSPLRIQTSSSSKERALPATPNGNQNSSVFFPPLTPGVSAKSPSITSPNRVGVGCNLPVNSNISTYHSMNRWNCEAISPLVYNISCNLCYFNVWKEQKGVDDHRIIALLLACIAAEWQINVMIDPLWLDHRKFAKRTLIEAIPILVEIALSFATSESKLKFDENSVEMKLKSLTIYLTRTLAEILCVESRQNKMDLKWIAPIIRAIELCMSNVLFDFNPQSIAEYHDALFAKFHRLPYQIQDLLSQIGECLQTALDSLLSRAHSALLGCIHASTCVEGGNSFGDLKSSSSLVQRFPDVVVESTANTSSVVDDSAVITSSATEENADIEDEFSDWDDEDDDDGSLTRTETCNSAGSVSIGNLSIVQSMECIQGKVLEWRKKLLHHYGIE